MAAGVICVLLTAVLHVSNYTWLILYIQADPGVDGNTFQDVTRLGETADNTERYI